MAILCPWCGREYDATLFQFGQTVVCDCGRTVAPFDPAAINQNIKGSRVAVDREPKDKARVQFPGDGSPDALDAGGPGRAEKRDPPARTADDGNEPDEEASFADLTEDTVVDLPLDGTLDLHTFNPADVKDLVPEYLRACREQGLLRIRIVHGKGTGELLRTVHALLERIYEVESFELAEPQEGGWGATIVHLRP